MRVISFVIVLPIIVMFLLTIITYTVSLMTNSAAIAIVVGWLVGIPIIISIRLLKYISFGYGNYDTYPKPWATTGQLLYSHGKNIASIPYSYTTSSFYVYNTPSKRIII
ncbi:hypothetical protein M0R01_02445 [bacterium]|nr:hypothetical protein [bacterium]